MEKNNSKLGIDKRKKTKEHDFLFYYDDFGIWIIYIFLEDVNVIHGKLVGMFFILNKRFRKILVIKKYIFLIFVNFYHFF